MYGDNMEVVIKDFIKELRKTRETKEKVSFNEIKARDRVDMSLEKYEGMIDKIRGLEVANEDLLHTCKLYQAMFTKIGIPGDVFDQMDKNSFEVLTCKNPVTLETQYTIKFAVSDELVGAVMRGEC